MPVVTEEMRSVRHHGHHKVAAAVFVGSLILGSALVLAAELTKPARYEYHAGPDPASYLLFDSSTGRTTVAKVDSKNPTDALEH
jgi:hypothetical protein